MGASDTSLLWEVGNTELSVEFPSPPTTIESTTHT